LIVATLSIIEYVEDSKLKERNKVIDIDYRLFVVDINLEEYFNETFSD